MPNNLRALGIAPETIDYVSLNENKGGRPMTTTHRPTTTVTLAAVLVCAAALVTTPAQAQRQGPLVLAKASYFFVGGKLDPAVEGTAPVRSEERRVGEEGRSRGSRQQ